MNAAIKQLARNISLVENDVPGYENLLQNIAQFKGKLIGITGAPGAGKSTLTDALITQMVANNCTVGVLCVDPSSPFNFGALLGDRIRMNQWYAHPQVYIRSLASRGSLGGLHPKIVEITDVMKGYGFDYIIVETVGVGQSEVEIAGLADVTVVVTVPEGGDDVQAMKSGLMEIADIFVVNKADRPDADTFVRNLQLMLHNANPGSKQQNTPVIKTVASEQKGIAQLFETIAAANNSLQNEQRKLSLLTDKALRLILQHQLKKINISELKQQLAQLMVKDNFNLYHFLQENYFNN